MRITEKTITVPMMIIKRHIVFILCSIVLGFCCSSVRAMNLIQPYDSLLVPLHDTTTCWHSTGITELGLGYKAFDECGGSTNALGIWNCKQSALDMLRGEPSALTDSLFSVGPFQPLSKLQRLANDVGNAINVFGLDDPQAGNFLVCGSLDLDYAGALTYKRGFCKDWLLTLFIPWYQMRLHGVSWRDLTVDPNVKTLLTDDLFAHVCELGNLDLRSWTRRGFGDLACFVGWLSDFPQYKEYLRNVRINWRLGLSIPTGLKEDVNRIMALPFGYDGAWALPAGLGIDIMISPVFVFGADVQLTRVFGVLGCHRIKTYVNQTELLLLHKRNAYKDYGLIQRFNLSVSLFNVIRGTFLRLGYQYFKQGESYLSLACDDCLQAVANTSTRLQETILHQFVAYAQIDLGQLLKREWCVNPRIAFFARMPFNGRQAVGTRNVGFTFEVNF